jgi:outer membrane lipopolysaccharide assembly protein LptE/RlpB
MFTRLLLLILSVGLLTSCGYRFPGQSEALPGGVKSVYLPLFNNRTNKPLLDSLMTSSLSQVLSRNAQIDLVGRRELADAVLTGEILSYSGKALSYTSSDDIAKYRVQMEIAVKLVRVSDGEILWQKSATRSEDYDEDDDAQSQDDYEEAARGELTQNLAEELYYQLVDDF